MVAKSLDDSGFAEAVYDRLPPHDIDSELCLIASLILSDNDEQTFLETRRIVRESSFYSADNQILFRVMGEMFEKGTKIDAVTLRAELQRRHLLEEIGGQVYIGRILNAVPSASHWEHYANIVREKSLMRELIALCSKTIAECYGPSREDRAVSIATHLANAATLAADTGSVDSIRHLGEAIRDVLSRKSGTDVFRLQTGMTEFDELTGGIPRGRFTIVGGRPGMGKSAFAKQVVVNLAQIGTPCGIITIEESNSKIAENVLSNLSAIENNKIAFGRMTPEEWNEVESAAAKASAYPVFTDEVSLKISEIKAAATRMVSKYGCKLIVVDYLQLIDSETHDDSENREITRISKGLKSLFKRLNVANLVPCQLNRGGESREIRLPDLKDLRGSGSLEQDGDLIVLLHRNDYYKRNEPGYQPTHELQAIIAKNKDNGSGVVPLFFEGKYQSITDWNGGQGPKSPWKEVPRQGGW